MIRRVLLCGVVVFWSVEARAQTVTDERVWFGVTVQEAASSETPWRWTVETVGRSRDGVSDLDTFLVRPSLMYALTAHASLGGGYAFAPNFPATGGTIVEQRIFGQFIWTGTAAGGTLSMRTRMESRFIEGNSGPLGRLRQQVRFIHVVKQGSRVSVVAYDEFAVHVNSTTRSPRGVDQNRAFGGVSLAATRSLRVEGGYLNQFLPGHRGAPDRMNHILSSTVVVSF
jgi:hypothetical protein